MNVDSREEWYEFLEEREDQLRREANSDAPDAHLFEQYLNQLEDYRS